MSVTTPVLDEHGAMRTNRDSSGVATHAGVDRFAHFVVNRREDGELDRLGIGAMGVTYRAMDTQLERPVALKTIHPQWVDDPEVRSRFAREAKAAARLQHPNIASVLFQGEEASVCFYVMELVCGENLHYYIKRVGPLSPVHALRMAHQIALALVAASREGIIHRDLKPANVMLTSYQDGSEPHLKVIDFGLAKLAADSPATFTTGGFLGTPEFASPEQCEERPLDARSDLYSLGGVLWFLLTAATPFTGSLLSVIRAQVSAQPAWETLRGAPEPLLAVLRRLMAKNRDFRPFSPLEASREIEQAIQTLSQDRKNFYPLISDPDRSDESAASFRREKHGTAAQQGIELKTSPRAPSRRWILSAMISVLCAAGGVYAWQISRSHESAASHKTSGQNMELIHSASPEAESHKDLPKLVTQPGRIAVASTPATVPPEPAPSPQVASPAKSSKLPVVTIETADGPTFTNSVGMRFVRPAGSPLLTSIWETRVRDFAAYAAQSSTLTSIANDPKERSWRNPGFSQAGDHPVVCVSPPDAVAFCRWLTEKEHKAGTLLLSDYYRLPTRPEWDELLTGGPPPEPRPPLNGWQPGMPGGPGQGGGEPTLPPWQGGPPPPRPGPGPMGGGQGLAPFLWETFTWPAPQKFANYGAGAYAAGKAPATAGDGFAFTAPVGSFAPNRFGLYDMSGNAAELCFDGPPLSTSYIKQGGSWASATQDELRRNHAVPAQAGQRDSTTGFRCVIGRTR